MEKLNTLTVDNIFCSAIKCIYSKVQCSGIRLTGNFTDWFNVNTGRYKTGISLKPSMIYLI